MLVVLEILHRFFMLLGRAPGGERPKISPFSGLGVLFPRVEAIFAGFQFANHVRLRLIGILNLASAIPTQVRLAFIAEL
jgi:hypothetical protein